MKFKEFTLDPFQEEAIASIEKDHSVVVSAATGTGKTLIADYIIDKYLKTDKKIIYTAPIKALSNQKYRDFKAQYGADKVGLITGDVVINDKAQVVIMTTEIYRNWLFEFGSILDEIKYVIFDEIHYMSDIERGTVWEESIIFSPSHIRFLCLSATIPNARQFAKWISKIKGHDCDIVEYMKRAVPLDHYVYDRILGVVKAQEYKKAIKEDQFHTVNRFGKRAKMDPFPNHIELIKELRDEGKLPCIFFVFSRKMTQQRAIELSKKVDFTTPEQKKEIISYFHEKITDNVKQMESTRMVRELISKGIAVHHAGLFPILKEIVENLFNRGLISVLYATETFAVGINMPAKTVCFHTVEKYDGISFRYLNSKEYFQLAGRAGRRGIDKVGYAIAMVQRGSTDINKIIQVSSVDKDPIVSRFDLSYNTVLNLRKNHNDVEISTILERNFGYFQRPYDIFSKYKRVENKLRKLGYIQDNYVTAKGEFASKVYSYELVITELVFQGTFFKLSIPEMNTLIAAIIYEPRRSDKFNTEHAQVKNIIREISKNKIIERGVKIQDIYNMSNIVSRWSTGSKFEKIMELSNYLEGDVIRLMRQIIDVLRQIKRATDDKELIDKCNECIKAVDRDVVEVTF